MLFSFIGLKFTTSQIKDIIANNADNAILQEGRNLVIKTTINGAESLVIKVFKTPKLINQVIYKYFRKSKAKRSYEYAQKLIELGVNTPMPISFIEEYNSIGLQESYYISQFQAYDLTFRELVNDDNYPEHEKILREFTYFCFQMHEKGIVFKDHSPGNTLIKKMEGEYEFYLVDLNRMKFKNELNFRQRMYNLRRLTPKKKMVEVMSDEYAKWYDESYDTILNTLWKYTSDFQRNYHRKRKLKQTLKQRK